MGNASIGSIAGMKTSVSVETLPYFASIRALRGGQILDFPGFWPFQCSPNSSPWWPLGTGAGRGFCFVYFLPKLPLIMSQQILQAVESSFLKEKVDEFGIGDTVDVHTKIQEGSKERIQIFSGTVIARSGSGSREMFVVRRIVAGEGVERKFPLHSPRIEKIEVKRRSVVRRAKLYFLRERTGKGVRLRERRDR